MNPDLYFVPILDGCLGSDGDLDRIVQAFRTIHRMGHEPLYSSGHRNFRALMTYVTHHRARLEESGSGSVADAVMEAFLEKAAVPELVGRESELSTESSDSSSESDRIVRELRSGVANRWAGSR